MNEQTLRVLLSRIDAAEKATCYKIDELKTDMVTLAKDLKDHMEREEPIHKMVYEHEVRLDSHKSIFTWFATVLGGGVLAFLAWLVDPWRG